MLSTTKLFTCTYSRPLNLTTSPIAATATAINVIFAVGLQAVQGTDPQTAVLQQHTFTGTGSLTIVRTDGSSSGSGGVKGPAPTTPGGGSTGNNTGGTTDPDGDSQASLDEILARAALYSKLVKAHGKYFSEGERGHFGVEFRLGDGANRFPSPPYFSSIGISRSADVHCVPGPFSDRSLHRPVLLSPTRNLSIPSTDPGLWLPHRSFGFYLHPGRC